MEKCENIGAVNLGNFRLFTDLPANYRLRLVKRSASVSDLLSLSLLFSGAARNLIFAWLQVNDHDDNFFCPKSRVKPTSFGQRQSHSSCTFCQNKILCSKILLIRRSPMIWGKKKKKNSFKKALKTHLFAVHYSVTEYSVPFATNVAARV